MFCLPNCYWPTVDSRVAVAKALSQEDHDIIVMDVDPSKCKRATESLDVIVVEGNGASPNVLLEAKVIANLKTN